MATPLAGCAPMEIEPVTYDMVDGDQCATDAVVMTKRKQMENEKREHQTIFGFLLCNIYLMAEKVGSETHS
ncbi:hypothetical protein ACTXT7_014250 [Hymenolepis weldensis]